VCGEGGGRRRCVGPQDGKVNKQLHGPLRGNPPPPPPRYLFIVQLSLSDEAVSIIVSTLWSCVELTTGEGKQTQRKGLSVGGGEDTLTSI